MAVIDVEGLSVDLAGAHPLMAITAYIMANYPHTALHILIVNGSPFIRKLWGLTRRFFPARIVELLDFVDVGELHRWVKPEALPPKLGGTLDDGSGDPRCPRETLPLPGCRKRGLMRAQGSSASTLATPGWARRRRRRRSQLPRSGI